MKGKLIKLMGIETYKDKYEAATDANGKLWKMVERATNRSKELEKELELYKADDDGKLQILMDDVKDVEELYKKRIEECDSMTRLAKADCDIAEQKAKDIDLKIHRAFAEGRMAAYSEMGIWNINTHTRGNILVRDDDGEVYEMIRGKLYDVDDDIDIEAAAVKIDDLLEGVDTE